MQGIEPATEVARARERAIRAAEQSVRAMGIGGTLAFFIARRTAEIGIRMSLGADKRRVMGMVLGDGGRLLALGLGLGLAGSAVLARAIRGMLFGVPPQDPVTFLGVAGLVLVVGLAVCRQSPALRAGQRPMSSSHRAGWSR